MKARMSETNPLPQTCTDCKHLGPRESLLWAPTGRKEWRECLYPLPNHIEPHSKPTATYHKCRTKEKE